MLKCLICPLRTFGKEELLRRNYFTGCVLYNVWTCFLTVNVCKDITPVNGSAQFLNGTTFEGNFTANIRVRFICNDGYMLYPLTPRSGTTNRCRPNGTWKKKPSTCIPGDYTCIYQLTQSCS